MVRDGGIGCRQVSVSRGLGLGGRREGENWRCRILGKKV